MSITLTRITPTQHQSAIEWIMIAIVDSHWVNNLTPQQAYRLVQAGYSGGWSGFVTDLGDDNWC